MSFKQIDDALGKYYESMGIGNYFDDGNGKFLKYVSNEAMNEDDITEELGDNCTADDCGYLEFDESFPFHAYANLNNTEKNNKIFKILQYCYKNGNPPTNDIQQKLENLQNDIRSVITHQINENIANNTSILFLSVIKDENYTEDDMIDDIVDNDYNDSMIIVKMIENDNDNSLETYSQSIHQCIKFILQISVIERDIFESQYLNKMVTDIKHSFIHRYRERITLNIQVCFCLFAQQNHLDNLQQSNITDKIKYDLNDNQKGYLLKSIMSVLLKTNYFNKYRKTNDDDDIDDNKEEQDDNGNDEGDYKEYEREHIKKYMMAILSGYKYFNLSSIDFKFNEDILDSAKKLVRDHCTMIYKHPGDVHADDDIADNNKLHRGQKGDKALCIAKAIELKNGYPLLLWLVDVFSRDRVNGHLINNEVNDIKLSNDRYVTNYDATKWWKEDNVFTRYISSKYPSKSEAMMHAIAELSFRCLPKYNFQHKLSPIICDNLNEFVKYTIIFHHMVHKITNSMTLPGHNEAAPIQFDFWIIPQAVKPNKMNPIFDEKEICDDDDDDKVIYDFERNLNKNDKGNDSTYNEMGKSAFHQKAQNAFWNLEEYLKKDGYREKIDYWVQAIFGDIGVITEQLIKIWKLSANGDQTRYQRYIFIIDRRNPKNLKNKNMGYKEPNLYKNNSDWKDKLYLIKPKKTVKERNDDNSIRLRFETENIRNITNRYYLVPEALLGYSKNYLFPNPDKDEPDPIRIIEAVNGYKWCLSYHILESDCVKAYIYTNQGSQRFRLSDCKWLWTKQFIKIGQNGDYQKLNGENINLLNDKHIYGKELCDVKFDEFWYQIHNINNPKFKQFVPNNNELFRDQFKKF